MAPALGAGAAGAPQTLEIAYAGSMASAMAGPIAEAARKRGWVLHGRAQGATALAQLIAGGSLHPDVFISATAEPMRMVLEAGKASRAVAIARTAMALAYAPHGHWADPLRREAWWQVLGRHGFRLGRADPRTDPQGRNVIYCLELAERYYQQPGLAHRLLGPWINPAQIFTEMTLPARVQSGELDGALMYQFQIAPFMLDIVTLPDAVNLGRLTPAAQALTLDLEGRSYRPEPLLFYAAALTGKGADAFVDWLVGPEAQAILRRAGYQPAGDAAPLVRHG